jgi:hypothetical protein
LEYPIVIDNDGATWKTWDNHWWPSTYLIDKKGVVRFRWDGELNWKKTKGEAILRKKIEQLLAEPGPARRNKPAGSKSKANGPAPQAPKPTQPEPKPALEPDEKPTQS